MRNQVVRDLIVNRLVAVEDFINDRRGRFFLESGALSDAATGKHVVKAVVAQLVNVHATIAENLRRVVLVKLWARSVATFEPGIAVAVALLRQLRLVEIKPRCIGRRDVVSRSANLIPDQFSDDFAGELYSGVIRQRNFIANRKLVRPRARFSCLSV